MERDISLSTEVLHTSALNIFKYSVEKLQDFNSNHAEVNKKTPT